MKQKTFEKKEVVIMPCNPVKEMNLRLSGYMNYDLEKDMLDKQIKNFIRSDSGTRLESWIYSHFKDEPFTGSVSIESVYTILNDKYNRLGKYVGSIVASVKDNMIENFDVVKIVKEDVSGHRREF